jgi:hypothetical protein
MSGEPVMPSDTDDPPGTPSSVENLINALDEVRDAMERLAAERRTTPRQTARDFAVIEPYSREDSSR